MKPPFLLIACSLLFLVHDTSAQSLDIALAGHGLSIGNSSRFTGLRINAVDSQVERIDGLNLTLWNPGKNPDAAYNGATVGLIGTKARTITGIALSGIGVNAREHLRGIAAGGLGVGANRLTGLAAGLIMVDVKERIRGIVLAGFWTGDCQQLDGIAFSLGGAIGRQVRGLTIGGLFAGGSNLTGLSLSFGGAYADTLRGVAVGGIFANAGGLGGMRGIAGGGLFVGGRDLTGIACSLGGIGAESLDGIMLAGLGLGAGKRIRGVAIGSCLVFAPQVTGVAVGALNGLYIDRIDLEDFLHVKYANRRFTGLSIGLFNYTAQLKGVQLGLLNYAGNNPRWLKLLPVVNLHI